MHRPFALTGGQQCLATVQKGSNFACIRFGKAVNQGAIKVVFPWFLRIFDSEVVQGAAKCHSVRRVNRRNTNAKPSGLVAGNRQR